MQLNNPFGGLVVIDPIKHSDQRGFFSETYNREMLRNRYDIDCEFVQDNHSLSVFPGVVRGLHFQVPPMAQAKLVRVTQGSVLDIVLDVRQNSPTFGHHFSIELSVENWKQLFIPVGFAHGFCTLRPNTEFLYKVSRPYSPEQEHGVLWDDPALGIDWKVPIEATLSDKDRELPLLADLPSHFTV
jgi:dTDP-4-dehydrorhamnose 3,5-epimerase